MTAHLRLAIADPPYLGRAARHYAPAASGVLGRFGSGPARTAGGRSPSRTSTTTHPDAAEWDNPDRHRRLVRDLCASFDGWAVALWPTSLPVYLDAAPADARVCAWVKVRPVPGGSRVITGWEPVLVRVPASRTGRDTGLSVVDTLSADPARNGHVGAKPPEWTRWVLALLGHRPGDIVEDLFPGSGAVSATLAQGVLL